MRFQNRCDTISLSIFRPTRMLFDVSAVIFDWPILFLYLTGTSTVRRPIFRLQIIMTGENEGPPSLREAAIL